MENKEQPSLLNALVFEIVTISRTLMYSEGILILKDIFFTTNIVVGGTRWPAQTSRFINFPVFFSTVRGMKKKNYHYGNSRDKGVPKKLN